MRIKDRIKGLEFRVRLRICSLGFGRRVSTCAVGVSAWPRGTPGEHTTSTHPAGSAPTSPTGAYPAFVSAETASCSARPDGTSDVGG